MIRICSQIAIGHAEEKLEKDLRAALERSDIFWWLGKPVGTTLEIFRHGAHLHAVFDMDRESWDHLRFHTITPLYVGVRYGGALQLTTDTGPRNGRALRVQVSPERLWLLRRRGIPEDYDWPRPGEHDCLNGVVVRARTQLEARNLALETAAKYRGREMTLGATRYPWLTNIYTTCEPICQEGAACTILIDGR